MEYVTLIMLAQMRLASASRQCPAGKQTSLRSAISKLSGNVDFMWISPFSFTADAIGERAPGGLRPGSRLHCVTAITKVVVERHSIVVSSLNRNILCVADAAGERVPGSLWPRGGLHRNRHLPRPGDLPSRLHLVFSAGAYAFETV